MIKELKKFQIRTTPFQATKNWQLDNVYNEGVILLEQTGSDGGDLAMALEYIDYGDGSGPAVTGSTCDIALEQQLADQATYREGLKIEGIFYPDTDPQNFDGTYKRVVFSQINTMFYNHLRNPTEIWGAENIDFDLSQTKRRITDQIKVFSVDRSIYGDKIIPGSIRIHDYRQDNDYVIEDDGYENLMMTKNLFIHVQEIGDFANWFADGSDGTCDGYFPSGSSPTGSIPIAPTLLVVTSGSAILNWTQNSFDEDFFAIERSVDGAGGPWAEISTSLAGVTTYTDETVTSSLSGATYWYQVAAVNTQGTSSYSNVDSITFTLIPPVSTCKSSPFPNQLFTESLQTNLTYGLGTAVSLSFNGDYVGPFSNGATINETALGTAWSTTNFSFYLTNLGTLNTTITNVSMSNTDFSSSLSSSIPFVLTSINSFNLNISKSVVGSASSTFTITHTDVSSPFVLYLASP